MDDLRNACEPMDLTNIRCTRMLLKMIEFCEVAQDLGRAEKQNWFDNINLTLLADTQDIFPNEVDELFETISKFHGFKGLIGKLETALQHHRTEAERASQHAENQILIEQGQDFQEKIQALRI